MPDIWRKVVKHPTHEDCGAVRVANTLWPSKYLTRYIGQQVWVRYDDLNVRMTVYEKAYDVFICYVKWQETDKGKEYEEQERQRLLAQEEADPEYIPAWDDDEEGD